MNSANFVTNLPTYLEQVIGGKLGVVHRNIVLFVHKFQIFSRKISAFGLINQTFTTSFSVITKNIY